MQKGLGDNARLVMVTHPILESRFFAAVELIAGAATSCARAPRAIRVIDEQFTADAGLIERYRDRLPFAPDDPVVTLHEGSNAARARARALASGRRARSG